MIQREEALQLLTEQKMPQALMQHSLDAEAVMQAVARHLGEDGDLWGMTGLLHDMDYPSTADAPEKHGLEAAAALAGKLPDEALDAIRAHNAEMNQTSPSTRLDYALRCSETVTGIISAAVLVRPTGFDGLEAKSIKKKMKDKAFAASVNRDNIRQCAELGLDLDTFLTLAINAMKDRAAGAAR